MTAGDDDDDLLLLFGDIVFILCCCCAAGMIALGTTTMSIVGLSKDGMSNADDVTDALLLVLFFPAATVQLHENALFDGRSKMMLYCLYSFFVFLVLSLQVRMIPSSTETTERGRTTASVWGGWHVGWSSFFD